MVSPLIALMKDQTDALRKRGVYAVAMDSTLKRDEYLQVQQDLREGTPVAGDEASLSYARSPSSLKRKRMQELAEQRRLKSRH